MFSIYRMNTRNQLEYAVYILPISNSIFTSNSIFLSQQQMYTKRKIASKKQNLEHKCILQESCITVKRWQISILLVKGGHCVGDG